MKISFSKEQNHKDDATFISLKIGDTFLHHRGTLLIGEPGVGLAEKISITVQNGFFGHLPVMSGALLSREQSDYKTSAPKLDEFGELISNNENRQTELVYLVQDYLNLTEFKIFGIPQDPGTRVMLAIGNSKTLGVGFVELGKVFGKSAYYLASSYAKGNDFYIKEDQVDIFRIVNGNKKAIVCTTNGEKIKMSPNFQMDVSFKTPLEIHSDQDITVTHRVEDKFGFIKYFIPVEKL